MRFGILRRNSRWPPKMAGKLFLRKVASRQSKYSGGKKFRRNRSISHRFWDKWVFTFYAEIQDGRQIWWENHFWGKLPEDSEDALWVKNSIKIALSLIVSEINMFLHFTLKFKMVAKKLLGKYFLRKVASRLYRYPVCKKICLAPYLRY